MLLLGLMLPEQAGAAVSARDDLGNEVVLAAPATRIVSLAPHATEMLFAIGAGERVVGAVEHSDHPPAAARIPRVGSASGFDLERILALRPDLVLAWHSGNPDGQVSRLEALGLSVFRSEPRALEDIPATLERLGRLAGTGHVAGQVAAAFRRRLEGLRERFRGRPPVRVFYQVWHQPLVTLNGEHLVSRLLDICGGRNVFAALPVLAPHIGVEAVLAADPEVIVAGGIATGRPPGLDTWRRWPTLSAVAHDNLFVVPADIIHRHTPRVLDGARQLCLALDTARRRLEAHREEAP